MCISKDKTAGYALSCQCAAPQIHFTILLAWIVVNDFQESTSLQQPLPDGEIYDHRKEQMERQKTQVMQKQVCLQMYLPTALLAGSPSHNPL